jgi:hypothetical protein
MTAVAGAFAALFTVSGAQAAPCTGAPPFTDVPTSAIYCTNTEWLANRGVTLGCVGTSFCPNDLVTRASMALFLNRLADSLVLPPVRIEDSPAAYTLDALANNNVLCASNVLVAANYPRSITLSTHVTARSASGQVTMGIQPLYSTNGGASWIFPNTFAQRVGFDATFEGNVSSPAAFTLPAGSNLAVGVGVFSVAGATGIVAGGRCHVLVTVQSLSGTSSPYDAEHSSGGKPDGS